MECINFPINVRIDFWCSLTSESRWAIILQDIWFHALNELFLIDCLRPDGDLLYPSAGTAYNEKTRITNDGDLNDLCSEFAAIDHEKILQRHFINASNSKMKIQQFHGAEIYVSKFEFNSVQNNWINFDNTICLVVFFVDIFHGIVCALMTKTKKNPVFFSNLYAHYIWSVICWYR